MKKGPKRDNQENKPFFFGSYAHSVDSQRRIAIPSAWRQKGRKERFFLLPGRHNALQLIPHESFEQLVEKVRKTPFADAEAALALARLGSMGQECSCDSQGRIALPQVLLDYAGISEQGILVGALTSAQIWAPKNWDKARSSTENVLDEIQKISEKPDNLIDMLNSKA